ncbi:MAG TPA: hypothetical protein VEF76_10340 [Patescibacteria group bacterium]|nr:hypothetical protein [Patescibacteria group bacterium]
MAQQQQQQQERAQYKVYSPDWFQALHARDPGFSYDLKVRLMISRTPEICTVCNSHSHRDYAIMADNTVSPVRLCKSCKCIYKEAFGEDAVVPFMAGHS